MENDQSEIFITPFHNLDVISRVEVTSPDYILLFCCCQFTPFRHSFSLSQQHGLQQQPFVFALSSGLRFLFQYPPEVFHFQKSGKTPVRDRLLNIYGKETSVELFKILIQARIQPIKLLCIQSYTFFQCHELLVKRETLCYLEDENAKRPHSASSSAGSFFPFFALLDTGSRLHTGSHTKGSTISLVLKSILLSIQSLVILSIRFYAFYIIMCSLESG